MERISNFELLLAIKDRFNEFEYYVAYFRILSENKVSSEIISEYFGISIEKLRKIENKCLKKIDGIRKDEEKQREILDRLSKKYGDKFNILRITPINPEDIIKYLYIFSKLTEEESKLYYYLYLSEFNFSKMELANYLEIDIDYYDYLYASLLSKMERLFKDTSAYKRFRTDILKSNGSKIFSINLNKYNNDINYDDLNSRYMALSYDSVMEKFNSVEYSLSSHEKELVRRYFKETEYVERIDEEDLLRNINVEVLGYKNKTTIVDKKKLYQAFLDYEYEFTPEQALFLECYFFQKKEKSEFISKYPDSSLTYKYSFLIDRLEKLYYNIYHYFDNNLSKEEYLKFKENFPGKLSEYRIEILDLVYGVNGKAWSISELAEKYGVDYIKMHDTISDARDAAIVFITGRNQRIDIDKDVYIPYIKDTAYYFTPEAREVLSLYLIDGYTYDELAQEMGLSKYRISNIITESIRKIDHYRYGLSEVFKIDAVLLEEIFNYYGDLFSDEEKDVLRYKHLFHMENPIISEELGITLNEVNKYARHFNILYYNYRIKDVTITKEDVEVEISKHISENMFGSREKEIGSLFFGIKNKYNPEGVKLSGPEIMEKMGLNKNTYYHLYQNVITFVKGKKIGIKNASYVYIERDKLDLLLDDSHLPISNKEREIICYLFELKGYPYRTLDELPEIFDDTKASVLRRYKRAILSIYKYLNNEIEGTLSYEVDIVPILKYFSISDRKLIKLIYVEGYTIEALAQTYNTTFESMVVTYRRVKTQVFDILNNPKAKKFDFDYYLSVKDKEDLPFYGNKELSISIFDLFFGMSEELRLSIPQIIERLNLEYKQTSVNRAANTLMLSVCKYRDGLRKNNTFTYEQIREYYDKYANSMTESHKYFYTRYFRKLKKVKKVNGTSTDISYVIIDDLLREYNKNYITLDKIDREMALDILRKYPNLPYSTRRDLMYMYGFSEREFMSGKDINHLYRLLHNLDKMLVNKPKELKKD